MQALINNNILNIKFRTGVSMSESKLVGKKKRNVSEVEMAQTGNADAQSGRALFQEVEDDDGFAKPKGV